MSTSRDFAALTLDELLARAEIERVLVSYCRGVDRGDVEVIRRCYHPDAHDDHGYWKGLGTDFASFIVEARGAEHAFTMHSITNIHIEFPDDSTAEVESHVQAQMQPAGRARFDRFLGRYVDRFAKRDGVWRIADRVVVHDWHDAVDDPSDAFALDTAAFQTGGRRSDDPTFGRFAF